MSDSNAEKKARRAAWFWKTFRPIVHRILKRRFRYDLKPGDLPEGGFLFYSNHETDLDPLFVGCASTVPLAFVTTEAVHRMGLLSKFIDRWFYTIDRYKGGTDAACALQVLRTVKQGRPVCMFPSGERAFTGRSPAIPFASAKIARSAKVPLVTFRISGGYLTSPRWADTMRKGVVHGKIVHIYSPEELASLSAEALHARITADLFVDAYALPPVPYRGRRLAERLETALYLCPRCGRADKLKSKGCAFFCECGLTAQLDETGRFSDSAPFLHPGAWDDWQQARMRELAAAASDEPVFSDDGMQLFLLDENHALQPVAQGRMTMSGVSFTLGDFSAPLSALDGFGLTQKDKLSFTLSGAHYAIRAAQPFCARKYCDLFRCVRAL